MKRPPPGLLQLVVAGIGAAAIAIGLVALLNGKAAGAAIAAGGAALLLWSIYGRKLKR